MKNLTKKQVVTFLLNTLFVVIALAAIWGSLWILAPVFTKLSTAIIFLLRVGGLYLLAFTFNWAGKKISNFFRSLKNKDTQD